MADTDLPKDAAKILQKAADQTRNTGKAYELTADQIKILAKAFNSMQDAASSASDEMVDAARNIETAFSSSHKTLMGFTQSGLTTGTQLQSMFAAIAGMMLDAPVKRLNEELIKEQKILDGLYGSKSSEMSLAQKTKQTSEDELKNLETKLAKNKQLCEKKSKCDESSISSLEGLIKKEKDSIKQQGDIIQKEKDKLQLDDKEIKKQEDKIKGLQEQAVKYENIKKIAIEMLEVFGDSGAFDRFADLDKSAESFRNTTKLMRDQMVDIEKAALNVNQELRSQGVSIEKAYDAATALVGAFSNVQTVTQDQIKAVAQLNSNLGVTNDNAAGFLQKMESVGGLTEKQSIGMAGLAAGAAKAAGVPLDKVMHDVANASDTTLAMMKGNVRQMTLAAIQAQRMGVSLEKTANAARGLLNFQESVDSEMEASVLLGKNLNLNYARQLSFQGDIAGAQKEIVNQVRSMGEFSKMNVFQQEALAKATGYSVADLTSMLKNEEKLSKLKPDQVKAYEDATKALKEQTEETGEQMLQQAQMQSAMKQLSNTYETFKQIIADILTPVVTVAVKLLIPVLKLALFIFNALLIPVKILSKALMAMWEPIEPIVQSISDAFDGMNGKVEQLVNFLVPVGVLLLKIATPLGWMIRSFTSISGLIIFIGREVAIMGASFQRAGGKLKPIGDVFIFIAKQIREVGKTGDVLKPIFNIVSKIFSAIGSGATAIIGRFTGILGMFGSAGGMVGKFAAGFGKVASVVKILGVAGKAIPFVGQVLTIIQAVWGFFSRVMGGMNIFDALGETLYDVFVSPFEMLFKLLAKIPVIGVIFEPILKIFPIIKTAIMDTFGIFKSAFNSLKEIFSGKDILKSLLNIGKAFLTGILTGILFVPSLILRTVIGIFPKMLESIKGFFSGVVDKIKGIFSGGGLGIGSMILSVLMFPIKMWVAYIKLVFVQIPKFIWTAITSVFTKISEWISSIDIFGGLMDGIKSVGSGIMGGITSAFGGALDGIKSLGSGITSAFGGALDGIKSLGSGVMGGITSAFGGAWDGIKGLFSGGGDDAGGMFSGIMDAIENIRTTITDTFKEIFTAIENTFSGLGETMGNIFNGVKSVVLTIIEPFQLIANVVQNIGDLLINNFFKGLTSIAQFIGGALSFPFKLIAKVVGVDTATVAPNESLDNNSSDDVKTAIQETNRKLDTLIQLMSNGGIGVYLDGRKVSEQLAIASS